MEKKLEIKHLAAYLPNQPFMYFGVIAGCELTYPVLGYQPHKILTYEDGESGKTSWMDLKQFQYHRLVLHPLSSLTKEITHKGETFVPVKRLFEICDKLDWRKESSTIYSFTGKNKIENMSYWIVQQLHEWMFDTNGLIESGLAIDANTLTENPYAK